MDDKNIQSEIDVMVDSNTDEVAPVETVEKQEQPVYRNAYFYCYSKRMMYFIKAFGIPYISTGHHKVSGSQYYVFPKSERLDAIIRLWNSVKYTIPLPEKVGEQS